MLIRDWKKEIRTIPNILSIFRLLLIPAYTTAYFKASTNADYVVAAGILTLSCVTDLLDGMIARKFHQVTTLGKILDPLADKATQCTLLLILTPTHKLLWLLTVLFLCKETFQLVAAIILWKQGKVLKGALYSGKICTAIIFTSLILLIMLPNIHQAVVSVITFVDLLIMAVAFLDYVFTYLRVSNRFQSINDSGSVT